MWLRLITPLSRLKNSGFRKERAGSIPVPGTNLSAATLRTFTVGSREVAVARVFSLRAGTIVRWHPESIARGPYRGKRVAVTSGRPWVYFPSSSLSFEPFLLGQGARRDWCLGWNHSFRPSVQYLGPTPVIAVRAKCKRTRRKCMNLTTFIYFVIYFVPITRNAGRPWAWSDTVYANGARD